MMIYPNCFRSWCDKKSRYIQHDLESKNIDDKICLDTGRSVIHSDQLIEESLEIKVNGMFRDLEEEFLDGVSLKIENKLLFEDSVDEAEISNIVPQELNTRSEFSEILSEVEKEMDNIMQKSDGYKNT